MIALVAIAPALACAGLALLLRGMLRRLSLLTWTGWTLLGAGGPVLVGQLIALALVSGEPDGALSQQAADQVRLALAAGLSGGFGWAAGAVSARLTGRGG